MRITQIFGLQCLLFLISEEQTPVITRTQDWYQRTGTSPVKRKIKNTIKMGKNDYDSIFGKMMTL